MSRKATKAMRNSQTPSGKTEQLRLLKERLETFSSTPLATTVISNPTEGQDGNPGSTSRQADTAKKGKK